MQKQKSFSLSANLFAVCALMLGCRRTGNGIIALIQRKINIYFAAMPMGLTETQQTAQLEVYVCRLFHWIS
jgi:hypothetical protein